MRISVLGVGALGAAIGLGVTTGFCERRMKTEYVKSHLEQNAPFLGLGATYEDRDKNGRLETYTYGRLNGVSRGFFRVTIEKDGSYKLTPARE